MARVALVTGSEGALFEAAAAELLRRGFEVRRAEPFPAGEGSLRAGARGAEVVVHTGVRTPREWREAERARQEAEAALYAARVAREAGARRFILVSTVSVYGRPRHLPCGEGEPKSPRSAFERARWGAERAAWAACRDGCPLVVLRPALVYGPTLRRGPVRALALVALVHAGRRHVPILRRGPVTHLVHLDDVARAVAHVAEHPDDGDVVGRAFNVADDAPLPLAEHAAAALAAMGHEPGRILPFSPRLWAAATWILRHVPDRLLLDPVNRRLAAAWRAMALRHGADPTFAPRLDREALHWLGADHYYDTRRLRDLGFRPLHPVSVDAIPATIHGLLERKLLPVGPLGAVPRDGPPVSSMS
ncbi:MAG TPA: SDR family oxidoreductase [Anaeromyxobacteraceae bacterium]|nr:SDR family oxidoreductase [Anaeromyxobacteraceae bacterium]